MHKTICLLVLVLMLCAAAASAAENGLLARYTFDEGHGTVVGDSSGNGNHGTISGGVEFIPHGDGYALQVDGKTGSIDLGNPESMNVKGDITIEAWIKTSTKEGDDRLIIGDTAGLSVNRNILFYNYRGVLRFDHGDDSRTESFMTETQPFTGDWQHVAFVAEYPNYYFYVNGKCISHGKMGFDISPTHGASKMIGGWWAGHFDGGIDDVRLYNRALSSAEIAAHAGVAAPKPSLNITCSTSVVNKAINIQATADLSGGSAGKLVFAVKLPDSSEWEIRELRITELRPGGGRSDATTTIKLPVVKPGDYLIKATLYNKQGTAVAEIQEKLTSGGVRKWMTSKAGITDRVPAPWTPVIVKQDNGGIDISVWGRVYRFQGSLFPAQVTSKGKPMLSSPIRVVAKVNGQHAAVSGLKLNVESSAPAAAVVVASGQIGGMKVDARHTIEYDGMIRTDWKIASVAQARLDSLSFNIPFTAESAQYLYSCRSYGNKADDMWKVGAVPDGMCSSSFTPLVWLGDDERGMQWACESAHNWFNTDETKAISIVKDNGTVLLHMSLIDRSVEIGKDKDLSYIFVLQASPVKPMITDCWDYRWTSCTLVGYGKDYNLLTDTVDGMPVLDYYQKRGVKTILIMNWTDILTYTSPLGQGENLRRLVQECHKRGIKLIPYFGYQINETTPEWPDFGADCIVKPAVRNPDYYPGMKPQMVDAVCLRSVWKDFLPDTIGKLIDDYDIDGIYLDSTIMPFACENRAHGCGYIDQHGVQKGTYPILDTRETLKRLYNVVKSRKPDGIVDIHPYDGMNLPALAFGTSYWTGEQLGGAKGDDYTDVLPLDRFRTDFMGVQWGVPAELLHYKLGDYKKSFAISLLHDVLVRPHGQPREMLDMESSLWLLAEKFGRKQAEWLPYWKNAAYVSTTAPDVYVSLYKHPENGVLAVVSNLGKQTQNAQVKFNLQSLGLADRIISAQDGLTNQSLTLDSGVLSVEMPVLGWKMVWIR